MTTDLAVKDDRPVEHLRDEAAEAERLKAILGVHALRMLRAMHLLVAATFDAELQDFRLDDSAARRILLETGARAVKIDATTQEAIRRELAKGQELGEGTFELTRRIEHLFGTTWAGRAELSNLVLLCANCHRWVHSKANTERLCLGARKEVG